MPTHGKLASIATAVESVESGSLITFSGFGHAGHPMAFVRELVRRGHRNLRLAAIAECWPAEVLVAAGAVSTIELSNLMFEGLGRCRALSRSVEEGSVQVEDHSHLGLSLRMLAAGWGMDFLPIRSMAGSDVVLRSQFDVGKYGEAANPFGGQPTGVVSPLAPDLAVIHVSMSDVHGNAIVEGAISVIDAQVRAAKRVILTAESITTRKAIRERNTAVTIPGVLVEQVVHAPFGAHPTGMYGSYDYSAARLRTYYEASRTQEAVRNYLEREVYSDASHEQYLERVGAEELMQLRVDPATGYSLSKSELL